MSSRGSAHYSAMAKRHGVGGGHRDKNEAEIVDALKKCGCLVERSDRIDLVVWSPHALKIVLIEVKRKANRKRIQPAQAKFLDEWTLAGAPVFVVTTVGEAYAAVGYSTPTDRDLEEAAYINSGGEIGTPPAGWRRQ